MAVRKKQIVVEVRRDGNDGRLYSQVRDKLRDPYNRPDKGRWTEAVVIDRQRGRFMDERTIISRAEALAELLDVPYEEDLTWPCIAARGRNDCRCPRCVESVTRSGR